jgi:hypothetical protein
MATKRWLGAAQDTQQVDTYEFTDTWAAGDTVTWTINNKALTLTVDGADTDIIAQQAMRMFMAKTPTENLLSSESRNFGGQQIPEFTELDVKYGVSVSGSILTLKWTAGIPVTISVAVSTVGDGDVTDTAVTAATGKHFFDNADNYEGGVALIAGDDLLLDQPAPDIKYALNNATADISITRTNKSTTSIGLPAWNPLGYPEYRQQHLDLPITSTSGTQTFTFGELNSPVTPVGFIKIDLGTNVGDGIAIYVHDAPPRDTDGYPIQIIRGAAILTEIYSGGVSFGDDLTASASTKFDVVEIHGDSQVLLGTKTELNASSTIWQSGGTFYFYGGTADSTPAVTIEGGTAELKMDVTPANAFATCRLRGGTAYLESNVTTMYVYGGATLSELKDQKTVTNCNVYEGATINNRSGMLTFSNGLDLHGCQPLDVTLNFPDHLTWTTSAI